MLTGSEGYLFQTLQSNIEEEHVPRLIKLIFISIVDEVLNCALRNSSLQILSLRTIQPDNVSD